MSAHKIPHCPLCSGVNEPAFGRGNGQTVVFGCLDLERNGLFGVLDCVNARPAVGHASRQLGHIHHKSFVLLGPPDDHFVGRQPIADKLDEVIAGLRGL
jgi:hypothetical protein